MATSPKTNSPDAVNAFVNDLDHPLATTVQLLRKIILDADSAIGEQIKWNAPSFYYTGPMKAFDAREYKRDIVVFNLRKPGYVLLIFPTGATIPDADGFLEGTYTDGRRMVTIHSEAAAIEKAKPLQAVIRAWLQQVVH